MPRPTSGRWDRQQVLKPSACHYRTLALGSPEGMSMRELRRTWRSLWRSPGLTVAAVSMLALGIGGNTAIFTVINAVLLRPLPLAEPDRLVVIHNTVAGRDE